MTLYRRQVHDIVQEAGIKTIYRYKTIHIAFSPRLCFKSVSFFFPPKECVHFIHIFTLKEWSCSVFFYYPFDFCEVMVMHQLSFMTSVICVTLFHLDHSDSMFINYIHTHEELVLVSLNFLIIFLSSDGFEFSILSFSNFLQVKHR